MRIPEEVTLAFKEASDNFTTVVGKPDDNNLTGMLHVLISTLMHVVKYDTTATVNMIFGIVASDEDCLATTGQTATFVIPAVLSIYDDLIPANDTAATCRKTKAARAEQIDDCDLYDAVDAGCRTFVLAAVEGVWYRKLCNLRTIYSHVTAKRLMAHIRDVCTGLHEIDAITILSSMMTMYKEVDSIPEYINVLEDARKRAARGTRRPSDHGRAGHGHCKPRRPQLRRL